MGYQIQWMALYLIWMHNYNNRYQANSFLSPSPPALCHAPFRPATCTQSTNTLLSSERRFVERLVSSTELRLQLDDDDEEEEEDDDDDDDDNIEDDDFLIGDSDEMEFGKFPVSDGDEDPLPPLPQFLNNQFDDDSTSVSSSPSSSQSSSSLQQQILMDETQRRIEEQQKQIDILMRAIKSRIPPPSNTMMRSRNDNKDGDTLMELTETEMDPLPPMDRNVQQQQQQVAPLRVMLFIDGTWLYYSIYERPAHLCPIIARYGRGWQQNYYFNWSELPRIVCEVLQEQERSMGWGDTVRPMEISRATVFTSVKKNTNLKSDRIQMFEDMKAANYDVYMMETVGSGEKCIDIQLAVEMLHYATVPNAYDVAILVSGDKDFMPALIRTRQKARKVGIVSKRPDCNRALYQTPNLIDYDVIWFEDYLDRLITLKAGVDIEAISNAPDISRFTVIKVIFDFIDKSNLPMVSSRDVGRYLKQFRIGQSDIQTELKRQFRGLHQVVREAAGILSIQNVESKLDKTFWITLSTNAEESLLAEARHARLSQVERDFFDTYSLDPLEDRERAYELSILELGKIRPSIVTHLNGGTRNGFTSVMEPFAIDQGIHSKPDYSTYTVMQLKDFCRERNLAVSGVKAGLIERLEVNDERQRHVPAARVAVADDKKPSSLSDIPPPSPVTEYAVNLVKEYVQASGGRASSRDIGRYLNANSSYAVRQQGGGGSSTALTELKGLYGSLARFINTHDDIFDRTTAVDTDGKYEYLVGIK